MVLSSELYQGDFLDIALHRKKRLADKKYEFTDDDEAKDKFVPLTRLRSKKLAEAEAAGWLNPLRSTSNVYILIERTMSLIAFTKHQLKVLERLSALQ